MHAVVTSVIVIHTPCGTIREYIVCKQSCHAEVYQIVTILKLLFQFRNIIPPEVHPAFGISCYVSGCDAAGHGFKPRWQHADFSGFRVG